MATKTKTASWSELKTERAGLIGLVQDLYATSKDNRTFLHARCARGGDMTN